MKLHGYLVLVSALALAACASSRPAQRSDENVAQVETRTTVIRTTETPSTTTDTRTASDAPRRASDANTRVTDRDRDGDRDHELDRDAPVASPPVATAEPDNTKVNERDKADSALTPMDQGNGESDLKITQRIRQAVVGDDSLSFNAKNVKIITKDGQVTLRGPVASAKERTVIGAAAKNVAGATRVDNQLEIEK